MGHLTLAKYQGSGNDFLLWSDPDRSGRFDDAIAAALCDRHRGIGADGLIRLSRPADGAGVRMDLRNADGGAAETSGNGLRCAALAAVDLGLAPGPELALETVAGTVAAHVATTRPGGAEVRVAMGEVRLVAEMLPVEGCRVFHLDVGNPHLVLIGEDLAQLDLALLGPDLESSLPGGTNVELVVVGPAPDELRLVVWERGVGLTLACGSGSCAAALAANLAGLTGERVTVHNPGGPLGVELGPVVAGGASVSLVGPAARVASVTLEVEELLASHGGAP